MSLTRIGSIGINTGIKFSGLTTITTLNSSIDTLSIGGPVSIAGTLTYEDVTNIDSVGLVTARNGIVVGSGITLSKDGDGFFTGVTTATTFVGALTGNVTGNISGGTVAGSTGTFTGDVDIADKIIHTGDTNTAIRFPEADTFSVETSGTQRLRVEAAGNVNFANNVNVSGTSTVIGIAQFANTINLTHASAGQNYIYFNEDLQLAKNGTGTRLKINSSGSVGIGTVTVSGAKLDVIDGIINVGAAVTTNDSRIQFTRKDTGIYSWIGIPTWNPNALYIYGPKDSDPYNEAAAIYESSTWSFRTAGSTRLQINQDGIITKPYTPSFFATINGGDNTTNINNNIPFDQTKHNNGSHYDTSNYYFVAPVDGFYYFFVQIWAKNGTSNARFHFHFADASNSYAGDNITQNGFHANGLNRQDTSMTASVVWQMGAGDRMSVRPDNTNLTYYTAGVTDPHSYFCGYLIG